MSAASYDYAPSLVVRGGRADDDAMLNTATLRAERGWSTGHRSVGVRQGVAQSDAAEVEAGRGDDVPERSQVRQHPQLDPGFLVQGQQVGNPL